MKKENSLDTEYIHKYFHKTGFGKHAHSLTRFIRKFEDAYASNPPAIRLPKCTIHEYRKAMLPYLETYSLDTEKFWALFLFIHHYAAETNNNPHERMYGFVAMFRYFFLRYFMDTHIMDRDKEKELIYKLVQLSGIFER
jgi:hypothetical protein